MTYEYMGRSTQISNVIINPFLHGRHFKMERYHRVLHGIKTDYCIPGHMPGMSLNLQNILENIEYV